MFCYFQERFIASELNMGSKCSTPMMKYKWRFCKCLDTIPEESEYEQGFNIQSVPMDDQFESLSIAEEEVIYEDIKKVREALFEIENPSLIIKSCEVASCSSASPAIFENRSTGAVPKKCTLVGKKIKPCKKACAPQSAGSSLQFTRSNADLQVSDCKLF